jgi:predicted PurR-regulated permease PerM
MNEKRLLVAGFGAAVAGVIGFLVSQFITAFTISIFLYYSSRRFYHRIARFDIPQQLSALVTIGSLVVPFILLLGYTIILLAIEIRDFVQTYPVVESLPDSVAQFEGVNQLPAPTIDGIVSAYQSGQLDAFIQFGIENVAFATSLASGLILNTFIITVITYLLLIEGSAFRDWLLRFDDEDVAREFFQAADRELEAVLFGNLLNVIIISLIGVIVFMSYNVVAPDPAEVPYPVLSGTLTGIASLIPVIGMKIVYIPLAVFGSVPVILQGENVLLVYLGGFLLLAIVVVDTIPDIVLRPYLSGKRTHVGLLMLAYIFGPVVLGFYGLFFAPIVLVIGLTFADTALPRLLGADKKDQLPSTQSRLDDF